ncbi:MAG: hypothetical protein KAJ42_15220 [Gemmatimonadetes bacterium]|nr:hypothetical protein [Gemmatimonadota bacterium]
MGSGLQTDELDFTTWETNETITIRAQDILGVVDEPASAEFPADAGPVSRIYFGDHSILVRDTRTAILAAIAALAGTNPSDYIMIRDEKADGVHGGTFTLGAFRTRDLNTIVHDDSSLVVSLISNVLILEAGTYIFWAAAPSLAVGASTARLRNTTAASDLGLSVNSFSGLTAGFLTQTEVWSFIVGQFTVADAQSLEIQHECQLSVATWGMGLAVAATTIVNIEIYTTIELWRL